MVLVVCIARVEINGHKWAFMGWSKSMVWRDTVHTALHSKQNRSMYTLDADFLLLAWYIGCICASERSADN